MIQSQAFKLFVSLGGIYTSYIYFGIIMEKLYNHNYTGVTDSNGKFAKFTFGFASSIFQNLFSFILAFCVNKFYYKQKKSVIPIKSQAIIGISSFGSVTLASQALSYISFPIQALMKSSKIISILIVSLILRSKAKHTRAQYLCGFLITLGIVIFNLTQEKSKVDKETNLLGLIFISISLFCDGYLGMKQQEMKKEINPSSWDQMETLNKWCLLFCLINSLFKFQEFVNFVTNYPAVITDLILISTLGTLGQIFIFYTIFEFGSLFLSILTTTRKFFTVFASIIVYNHTLNSYQWMSIVLVFTGVFIELLGDKKNKEKKV